MSTEAASTPPVASTSTPSHLPNIQVDPSLLGLVTGHALGKDELPLDPALFAIEQVVNDVRKGKIKSEEQSGHGQLDNAPQQVACGDAAGTDMLDEEFDPALREIVNSLTNAQQVCTFPD